MKTITQGWNFGRVLRLVLGIAVLVQGAMVTDVTSIILGLIVSGTAVANIGCCGPAGCGVRTSRSQTSMREGPSEVKDAT